MAKDFLPFPEGNIKGVTQKNMTIKPIYIFSLPRSGSTLLQRILAGHSEIVSISEMWFLLPFVYTLKETGTFSQYSSVSLNNAIRFLLTEFPKGKQDYFDALRKFSENLYALIAHKNEKYVLDKTPRYYMIIKEIEKIFPDGKFIFLFRHPLSILASIIENFNNGKLGDWRHKIDLYKGPFMLCEGYKAIKRKSIAIQYESLIDNPKDVIKDICNYLSISYSQTLIKDFSKIPVKGLGDKIGYEKYNKLEMETKEKWKTVLSTRYRKRHAIKYIRYLGENCINTFGYDMNKILRDVYFLKPNKGGSLIDIYYQIICSLKSFTEYHLMKKKIKDARKLNDKYYVHY